RPPFPINRTFMGAKSNQPSVKKHSRPAPAPTLQTVHSQTKEHTMSPKLKALHQQVIVITGASSGIGLATAQLAAQRGAKVVLSARSSQTLDEVVSHIKSTGHEAIAVAADVADREQVQKVADA